MIRNGTETEYRTTVPDKSGRLKTPVKDLSYVGQGDAGSARVRPIFDLCRPVNQGLDGGLEEAFFLGRMGDGMTGCLPGAGSALVGAQLAYPTQNPFWRRRSARRLHRGCQPSDPAWSGRNTPRRGAALRRQMPEVMLVHAVDVRTSLDGGWWRFGISRRLDLQTHHTGGKRDVAARRKAYPSGRRFSIDDFRPIEAERECVRASCEADNEFPVADVVGLDRETCRLFGRLMLLQLEADPPVFGLHAEAVFIFVQQSGTGPVDNIRPVLDSVMEGHDVRIVHRHVLSFNARPEVMYRAGMGLAIAKSPDPAAHPWTGSHSRASGKPWWWERVVRRIRRRRCAAVRRRRNGAGG